jgi:hypothetical protein
MPDLKSEVMNEMLKRFIFSLVLCGLACVQLNVARTGSFAKSKPEQWTFITEGVGIVDVLIGKSTKSDVLARYGNRYKLIKHNEYSREMEYADLGLSFYYCFKDTEKKIFLIEVHQGATSKGIVIGQSTLKDVYDLYGEEKEKGQCDSKSCVYEYKGVQFYIEGDSSDSEQKSVDLMQKKVIEVDVVSPDKSSNFCNGV